MGRKSLEKERKPLSKKAKSWVRELVPLLQNKDLNSITLDDIAELIGKSKSTIYTYFSTKEDIFQTAVQSVLAEMQYSVSIEAVQGNDMEAVLERLLFNISEGIHNISIEFLNQIKQHYPSTWQDIQDFTNKLLDNLQSIYKNGMSNGTFKSFNTHLLLTLDQHFVMNVMTDSSMFNQEGLSLRELVQEYIELRLSALRIQ